MKHNESVYRSPKWLRNFFDYEINTGNDIKGDDSEKKKLSDWDKRWDSFDETSFILFFSKNYDYNIYSSKDLDLVRKNFRGDDNLWKLYDAFLVKEEEKRKEQIKLKAILDGIFKEIKEDFENAPYSGKMSGDDNSFTYKMENGFEFKMYGNKISYKGNIYTIGTLLRNKFVKLINEMNNNTKRRRSYKDSNSYSRSSYSSSNDTKSKSNSKPSWIDHPKADTYLSLKKSISLRREQLSKMKQGADKTALQNELDTAEAMLIRMKDKYKFENIKSYFTYIKV